MNQRPLYRDRHHAGEAVADALAYLAKCDGVLVLGLPRGGVIVARAVADALGAPLDVIVARKVGVPGLPEVALGAIVEGEDNVTMDSVAWYLGVPTGMTSRIAQRERRELERRVQRYRGGRPLPDVQGRTVVLVDDGLATGATIRAAVQSLRRKGPARIIVACPVGSVAGCHDVAPVSDEMVVLATPEPFEMVSEWYEDFAPVSDRAVLRALQRDVEPCATECVVADPTEERCVNVPIGSDAAALTGDLGVPDEWIDSGSSPRGLVVFAHGGGSSRQSYRNRFLAGWLRMAGWATLRLDLLLPEEQARDATSGVHRFDVALIGGRLTSAIDWAVREKVPGSANIVLFGASTGAAAAVLAAVERPDVVTGVVARGGRVDLAAAALARLRTPILMIVGGADAETLRGNRLALRQLRGDVTLKIIRRADHVFEAPGAIGAVGAQAIKWLNRRHPSESRAGRRPLNVVAFFARKALFWLGPSPIHPRQESI